MNFFLRLLLVGLLPAFLARAQSCGPQQELPPTSFYYVSFETTAALIGFSEYTSPSNPPKKYRQQTLSGSWCNDDRNSIGSDCGIQGTNRTCDCPQGNHDREVYGGSYVYDKETGAETNGQTRHYGIRAGSTLCGSVTVTLQGPPPRNFLGPFASVDRFDGVTQTEKIWSYAGNCIPLPPVNGNNYLTRTTTGTVNATLSVPDEEEDALNRALATATQGTSDSAFREQRSATDSDGDPFTFGFRDVTYHATFGLCPGQYQIDYHHARRPLNSPAETPWEEIAIISENRSATKSPWKVEKKVPVNSSSDYEYTITHATATSLDSDCGGGGTVGSGNPSLGSVRYVLNLGKLDAQRGAGVLLLRRTVIDAAAYSPAALEYIGPGGATVDMVRDGSAVLRQIKVPEALANIVTLESTQENPRQGYNVEFYHISQVGAKDPVTGLYDLSLAGDPYVTHCYENPAGALVPSLKVTETRPNSLPKSVTFFQDTNNTWGLIEGGGLRVTEEVTTTENNGSYIDEVKTRTLKMSAPDSTASVVATTYRTFPWGTKEKIKEVLDPDNAALTTTWDYYSTSVAVDGANNYRRMKQRTDANGYWEIYTYGTDGSVTKTKAPHLEAAPTADDSLCRITTVDHPTLADATVTRTTETLLGQEISRSYEIEWTAPVAFEGDTCERETTVRCAVPGTDWNAETSLKTEILRYASGDFEGRLRRELRPDGTATFVTYSLNSGNGQLTTTTLVGQPNEAGTSIVAGRRTITVTNAQGHLVSEDTDRIDSTPANLPIASTDALLPDAFGRPTRFEYLGGAYETRTYACCGLDEERDREGIVTVHGYDALGRHTHTTRAGVTLKTTYDAAGRAIKTERYPENNFAAAITLSETDYDLAGRVVATRDAAGRQTDILETLSPSTRRTTTVTTLPGPSGERGTITEIHAADGQLLRRTGSAAAAVGYDYGIATLTDAGSWGYDSQNQYFSTTTETKLDAAGDATDEVVTTYADALGRTVKTVYADDAAARSFYNNKGQIVRQTDPDDVQTLYEYNALGESERTILDSYRDSLVTEVEPSPGAGADRITRTTRSYLQRTDDSVVTDIERTVTEVWADHTSSAATTVSTVDRSVDGRKSWSEVYGLTTRSVTTYGPTDGLRTETVTQPDNSTQVSVYLNGRLQSVTRRDSASVQVSAVSYGYDSHGRSETVTDARTGTTTYVYDPGAGTAEHPANDDLWKVITPDPDLGSGPPRSGPGYDAQTTIYHYDDAGRVDLVTLPDHTTAVPSQVHTTYWPGGQVKRTWGSRTYPSEYTYDAQGRVKTLTTWQDFAGSTGVATTTWDYDPERGWLSGKRYHDNTGPAYTYWPSGRLKTRDWVRTVSPSGSRLRATYTYNNAGELWTVVYNDTAAARPTSPVTQAYDRLGRPLTTTDAAGLLTRSYQNGRLDDEVYSGSGLLSGQLVSRAQDSLQRLQTLTPGASALAIPAIGYGYDNASRLQTITRGIMHTATYGYLANSSLIETVTLREGSAIRLTTTRVYDKLNRLESIANVGASATRSAAYEFDGANRRQRLTREDNAYWDFGYDSLGQVTGAIKRRADAAALPGHAFAFDYDDIGNRQTTTTNGRLSTYTPDLLNRYTQRTVPGAVDVGGEAQATATVTVNNQPTQRLDGFFHAVATADNSAAPQYVTTTVVGVKNNVGSNGEDAITEITRHVFLARTPEVFSYDADGNLIADGRWSYEWDAENRLIAMETLSAVTEPAGPLPAAERRRLEFAYDANGRRIQKVVKTWNGNDYVPASDTRFLYDGWNLVAEYTVQVSGLSLHASYVWGLDLSGSGQGAGGIGGLLLSSESAGVYAAAYDGNGDILALCDAATGNFAADFEYDPFGEVLKSDGPAAGVNSFGFSTKYLDKETGLYYYGFRYYNPSTGRWLSRDPIGEHDVANLYVFASNAPTNKYDVLGLWGTSGHTIIVSRWLNKYSSYKWIEGSDVDVIGLVDQGSQIVDGDTGSTLDFLNAQSEANSYQHAMRAPYESVASAKAKMGAFVLERVRIARDEAKKARETCDLEKLKKALVKFGEGMHPVMDSTSPAHEGFQVWFGPQSGGAFPVEYAAFVAHHHYKETDSDLHAILARVVGTMKGYDNHIEFILRKEP